MIPSAPEPPASAEPYLPSGLRTILDASEKLIARYGFDALRLRDIAEVTGLSIGAIQHHFRTRDDAAAAMMRHSCTQRMAGWQVAIEGMTDPTERLRTLMLTAVSSREHSILWVETCAAATRYAFIAPVVQQTNDAWMALLEDEMARLHAAGQAPGAPGEPGSAEAGQYLSTVAEVLVTSVDGFSISVATGSTRLTAERANQLLARTADAWLGTSLSGR